LYTAQPSGATTLDIDESPGLNQDQIFGLLSNERRRLVLRHLAEAEETVRVRDLATQIAAWENEIDPVMVTYKQRKRAYTSLYQGHLSKMDDCGVVEYDRSRGTVTPTAAAGTLNAHLLVAAGESGPTTGSRLELSAVTAGATIVGWWGSFTVGTVFGSLFAAMAGFVLLAVLLGGIAFIRRM